MQYLMRQIYTILHSPAAKIEKSHGFTIGTNFGRKWGGLLTGDGWCDVEQCGYKVCQESGLKGIASRGSRIRSVSGILF